MSDKNEPTQPSLKDLKLSDQIRGQVWWVREAEAMPDVGDEVAIEDIRLVMAAAELWADFLDDPVAAVRRGVESGTIKGEEIECLFCEGMGEVVHDIDCEQCVRDGGMAHAEPCPECRGSGGLRVVVVGPVSDGGSET